MAKGNFLKSVASVSVGVALLWAIPLIAQELPPLPPLPEDPVTTEMNQLRQESADLRQEAREIGGGRTIRESIVNVNGKIAENRVLADRLEELAEQAGYTQEQLRAEQKRIADSGGFGLGDFTKGQVRDKAAEEAIKRIISESAGKAFGLASWASTCYDFTTRIKRWWMVRQQAGSLGDSAESTRQNFIALNRLLIALYGQTSLEIRKVRRLEEIKKRYDAIWDRMAELRQQPAKPGRATANAVLDRETDSAYDHLLSRIERLKFERRIADLQGDSGKVRQLNVDIRLLEMQAEREERVPGQQQRSLGMAPQPPLDKTSASLLAYQNALRAEVGSPPLQWNAELAARAGEWARVMAETGQLKHSPRSSRPKNERENLSISRHNANSPIAMVKTWGDEKQFFRPGIFPDVCAGDWSTCGHYTQVVWSTTTDVGCGFHAGSRFDALVCRYSPPGNADGKPVLVAMPDLNMPDPCPPMTAAASAAGRPW